MSIGVIGGLTPTRTLTVEDLRPVDVPDGVEIEGIWAVNRPISGKVPKIAHRGDWTVMVRPAALSEVSGVVLDHEKHPQDWYFVVVLHGLQPGRYEIPGLVMDYLDESGRRGRAHLQREIVLNVQGEP